MQETMTTLYATACFSTTFVIGFCKPLTSYCFQPIGMC